MIIYSILLGIDPPSTRHPRGFLGTFSRQWLAFGSPNRSLKSILGRACRPDPLSIPSSQAKNRNLRNKQSPIGSENCERLPEDLLFEVRRAVAMMPHRKSLSV